MGNVFSWILLVVLVLFAAYLIFGLVRDIIKRVKDKKSNKEVEKSASDFDRNN